MAVILSGWGRWSWIDWLLYIQLFRRYVQLPIRVQGICSPLLLGHHSNPSTDDICSCQIGRFGPIRLATRWRHDMETLSSSLALCAWNSPVTGGFHRQRASYAERWCIFFAIQAELSNKQLVIWNTMALIWRHCNGVKWYIYIYISVRQLRLDSEKEYSNAPHYWPFVSGIHRGPVDSLHKNISIAQRICMYVLLEHLTFNDVFARNTDRVLTTSKERLQHCSHIGDDTNKHITHLSLNLTHGRHFSDDILV